jgi:hypothetical protein
MSYLRGLAEKTNAAHPRVLPRRQPYTDDQPVLEEVAEGLAVDPRGRRTVAPPSPASDAVGMVTPLPDDLRRPEPATSPFTSGRDHHAILNAPDLVAPKPVDPDAQPARANATQTSKLALGRTLIRRHLVTEAVPVAVEPLATTIVEQVVTTTSPPVPPRHHVSPLRGEAEPVASVIERDVRPRHARPVAPPPVHISIGRIEVRAEMQTHAKPERQKQFRPRLELNEYLARRSPQQR